MGMDTSCHKRYGETGNFLICFCQTKRKYIYDLIGVLELHAVLFYSSLHVNLSDSYVIEHNDPFTLGMSQLWRVKEFSCCYKMATASPWRGFFHMNQIIYGGLGLDQHLEWLLEELLRKPARIEIHPWPPQYNCLSEIQ